MNMSKLGLNWKEFLHGLSTSTALIFTLLVIIPMLNGQPKDWELFVSEPWRLLAMVLTWLIMVYMFGFIYKISPEDYKRLRY